MWNDRVPAVIIKRQALKPLLHTPEALDLTKATTCWHTIRIRHRDPRTCGFEPDITRSRWDRGFLTYFEISVGRNVPISHTLTLLATKFMM